MRTQGFASVDGEARQRAAILYTIVENCRRLGINTREYLEDVLTRLPGMMGTPVNTAPWSTH